MAVRFDPIEVFFWAVYLVVGLIGLGIEYLREGYLSKGALISFAVYIGSMTVGQMLAGFHERQNKILDGLEKLKSQNEAMKGQIQGLEKSLDNIERAAR
jgi:hypothetical protein